MIVVNGYKDEEFMRLALMARSSDPVFIVLEQLSEVDVLLSVARPRRDAERRLRIKLYSEGSGRWAKSGGEIEVRLSTARARQARDS